MPLEVNSERVKHYSHDVHPISDAVLTEQQKIADVFFDLKLIPKPINVKDAVLKAKP